MIRAAWMGLAVTLVALAAVPAMAQKADSPLEITAQDVLEWRRNENALVAQGKVVVTRGAVRLRAESVSAFYRDAKTDGAGDKQEVYRLDATGDVRIESDGAQAFGGNAAYDLDQAVFVLTGGSPRFEASDLTVTASRNLEYWQDKQLAVARGEAVAKAGARRIAADVLSAYVSEGKDGKLALRKVEAFGGVLITTAEERASGDQAVYDAETGIATLCGSVEIQRGGNALKGSCAEFDLNTGNSRLIGGGGGIKGLVKPPN